MARTKKEELPLTKELVEQARAGKSEKSIKNEYLVADQFFEKLNAREKDRYEMLHEIKQIRRLLFILCQDKGIF